MPNSIQKYFFDGNDAINNFLAIKKCINRSN